MRRLLLRAGSGWVWGRGSAVRSHRQGDHWSRSSQHTHSVRSEDHLQIRSRSESDPDTDLILDQKKKQSQTQTANSKKKKRINKQPNRQTKTKKEQTMVFFFVFLTIQLISLDLYFFTCEIFEECVRIEEGSV